MIALLLGTVEAQAQSVTLTWDRSPEADVAGYTVYVGVNPGTYAQTFDRDGADNTTFTFTQAIPGTRYYFSVAAYDTDNLTSPRSNEVSWKINVGPELTQPSNQAGAVGVATSLQLDASDDSDPLTFGATGLPPGLSINTSSGRISGTPTTAGTFTVNATVSDGPLGDNQTFTWTIGPRLTVTSFIGAPGSPQSTGDDILFTAVTIGGVAPHQYKFSVSSNSGSTWTVARNWGTGATFTWTPTTSGANYRVKVDVRSAGVTADVAEDTDTLSYVINNGPLSVTSLTSNLASPQPVNTAITFTAVGAGGTSPYQFKYLLTAGATTTVLRDWNTSASYTWTPTTANAAYVVTVWARSAGATADVAEAQRTINFAINAGLTIASLTSNVASPQIVGTSITFTATGSGGIAPYQFKYSVSTNSGSSYTLARNWSTTATFTWAPTAVNANYRVKVDARNAGVTADVAQATANVPFSITSAPPPTADSVTPNTGTGGSQAFAFRFSDGLGATNLATAWVWFSPTFSTAPSAFTNTCFLYYQRNTNTLNLLNNAGTSYTSGTVGNSGTLQNAQCSISLATSSAPISGNTLTLNLPMTFTGNFSGAKNIYMDAVSTAGTASGWPDRGNWTVPAGTPPPQGVAAVSSTPNSGSGASQTFSLLYSDTAGVTDLATTWAWFTPSNGSGMWVNSCFLYYQRATNTLNLLNDSGGAYASGTLGSGGTVSNSQCSIALGSSSASASGTNLTLNVAVTFAGRFAGAKSIYMDAVSNGGATSGWPDRGDWTVPSGTTPPPAGVAAVSASPNSGTGASQTFALQYSDTLGATDLATTWAWFAPTFSTAPGAFTNTCFLYYQRNTHTLYLLNNAGTAYVSGPVGSAGTLQNSQCTISLVSSSVALSGNTLTMNLPMTFAPTFAGAKNIYIDAVSASGLSSGWPDRGDWTVPGGAASGVQAVSASPNTGSGLTRTFTLTYSDSQGAADIATAWVWFTPAWSTAPSAFQNACFIYYQRSNNTLYLLGDSGSTYVTRSIFSPGTLQNSQCAIAVGSSQAVLSGNTLTLTLAMTFKAPFAGTKNIFMDAVSNGGVSSGWPDRGDWIVP